MAAVPDLMPVLSRGKHKDPSRGACFLEYTALLAGEPFSDEPACVDRELAAVLRRANDLLKDGDRPRLLALLGRAVGLAIAPPPAPDWRAPRARRHPRPPAPAGRARDAGGSAVTVVPPARARVALPRAVPPRSRGAIGFVPTEPDLRGYDDGGEVELLFGGLMHEPERGRGPAYIDRLLD